MFEATANAQESINWGTNIVGGVTPGKDGEHLGRPVLPTVREVSRSLAQVFRWLTGFPVGNGEA